jgi:hypothetical protein
MSDRKLINAVVTFNPQTGQYEVANLDPPGPLNRPPKPGPSNLYADALTFIAYVGMSTCKPEHVGWIFAGYVLLTVNRLITAKGIG